MIIRPICRRRKPVSASADVVVVNKWIMLNDEERLHRHQCGSGAWQRRCRSRASSSPVPPRMLAPVDVDAETTHVAGARATCCSSPASTSRGAALKVTRKYRRSAVRRREYRKLKAIVPSVSDKHAVSKVQTSPTTVINVWLRVRVRVRSASSPPWCTAIAEEAQLLVSSVSHNLNLKAGQILPFCLYAHFAAKIPRWKKAFHVLTWYDTHWLTYDIDIHLFPDFQILRVCCHGFIWLVTKSLLHRTNPAVRIRRPPPKLPILCRVGR